MRTVLRCTEPNGLPPAETRVNSLVVVSEVGQFERGCVGAVEPQVFRDLVDARAREDWNAVGGIIDWLAAGL